MNFNKKNKVLAFSGFDFDVSMDFNERELNKLEEMISFQNTENLKYFFKFDDICEKLVFFPKNNLLSLLTVLNKSLIKKFVVEVKTWNVLDKFNKFPSFSRKISTFFKSNQIYLNPYSESTRSKIKLEINVNGENQINKEIFIDKNTDLLINSQGKSILKPLTTIFPSTYSDYIFIDLDEILSCRIFSLKELSFFLNKSQSQGSKIILFFPSVCNINFDLIMNLVELINMSSIVVYDNKSVLNFLKITGNSVTDLNEDIFKIFLEKFSSNSKPKKKISIFLDCFYKVQIFVQKSDQIISEKKYLFNIGFRNEHPKIFEKYQNLLKYVFLSGFLSYHFSKFKIKDCFQAGLEIFHKMLNLLINLKSKFKTDYFEGEEHFLLPMIQKKIKKRKNFDNNKEEFILDTFNLKPLKYEALADKNLTEYFSKKIVRKQLKKNGLIPSLNSKFRATSLKPNTNTSKPVVSKEYLSKEAFLGNLSLIEIKNGSFNKEDNENSSKIERIKRLKINSFGGFETFGESKFNKFSNNYSKNDKTKSNAKKTIFTDQNNVKKQKEILEEKIRKFSNYRNKEEDQNLVIYEKTEEFSELKDLSEKSYLSVEKVKNEGIYVPRNKEILIKEEI